MNGNRRYCLARRGALGLTVAVAMLLVARAAAAQIRGSCGVGVAESKWETDAYVHRLTISVPGAPAPTELLLKSRAARIDHLLCSSDRSSAVLFGPLEDQTTELTLVGLQPPRILQSVLAQKLTVDYVATAIYFWEAGSGCRSAFDMQSVGAVRLCDPARDALDLLRQGDLRQQELVLGLVLRDAALRQSAEIRSALASLLARAIDRDQLEAQSERQVELGVRPMTPWRAWYGALVAATTVLEGSAVLPLLARVDEVRASGALVQYGPESLDAIFAMLRTPTPPGYSSDFKARLVRALQTIADLPDASRARTERRLGPIVAERLALSEDRPELIALVRLADALDDPRVTAQLEQLASSPEALRARGIADPTVVSAIQVEAQAVLSRRLVAR